MCGIAGIIADTIVSTEDIKALCDPLSKRGPDAEGYFVDRGVALGHRRLSIIDLETGAQPMYSSDKTLVLVYNGEMYNFLDIRKELQSVSITFQTQSDTEVVLEGYRHYGIKGLLEKAEGMFAFALYDILQGKIYIARDKFGEKPLYYIQNEKRFEFASELKALEPRLEEKKIDEDALNLFLSLSYIPAPYTIYKQVNKLEAGYYFEIDIKGEAQKHSYYQLQHRLKEWEPYPDFEAACVHLRDLLFDSVRKRMIADVPLGSFLSGGIDSSIITAIMAKVSSNPVQTYSIGFTQKEYDESERAELLAKHVGTRHTVQYLDYHDVTDYLDEIIQHFDEPFGDSSAIPSFYVAKVAALEVKVVLTGDCADELFGGYEKYLGDYYAKKFNRWPAWIRTIVKYGVGMVPHNRFTNSYLRRVKKVIYHSNDDHFSMHYQYMCLGFQDEEKKQLLQGNFIRDTKEFIRKTYSSFDAGNDMEKGFYTDLHHVLEGDMLVKVDRMCMKNSLEARVPFLDSKIVEAAYTMPLHYKIQGRNKKYILKKTFGDLLPKNTLRFRKKGFGVPVDYWLKHELKEKLESMLDPEFIRKQGIFNADYIQKILKEHFSGKSNHKGKLWNLYVFQQWFHKHMA